MLASPFLTSSCQNLESENLKKKTLKTDQQAVRVLQTVMLTGEAASDEWLKFWLVLLKYDFVNLLIC